VQAKANISKELKNTVKNLQRELVMSGEMQSQQRNIVSHVNALRYDASNAMLGQESYKHNINGMCHEIFTTSKQGQGLNLIALKIIKYNLLYNITSSILNMHHNIYVFKSLSFLCFNQMTFIGITKD